MLYYTKRYWPCALTKKRFLSKKRNDLTDKRVSYVGHMENVKYECVIVRYGEIAIKSEQIRGKYERLLIRNIAAMLDQDGVTYSGIGKERGRIFIFTEDTKAATSASKVFGVVSASSAAITGTGLDEVTKLAAAVGKETIKDGESYAVMARRAGAHAFTSQDLGKACGDAIWYAIADRHPRVDLKHADREIHVEVRETKTYVFTEIVKGVGGMPLGSQGKMVALISGGIDSPVAAWLMMKRGCDIIPVYFDLSPYGDETTKARAIDCVSKLKEWSPGRPLRMYVMPHGKSLEAFLEKSNVRYVCVFCKHMMYKASVELARKEGAHGIVTGSSLGQVASQTSENMMIEHHGIDFPIYHPLIGMDKNEIVELARRIGTMDISTKPATCCSAVPKHPAIHGRLEEVKKLEEGPLGFDSMVKAEVEGAYFIDV